jgi:hypothetical protein
MQEFEVQLVNQGVVTVSAESQEAAEEKMRRNGYRVKPKAEIDRELGGHASKKREEDLAKVRDVVEKVAEMDKELASMLNRLRSLRADTRPYHLFNRYLDGDILAEHTDTKFKKSMAEAVRAVANALSVLRLAKPAAENHMRTIESMTAMEFYEQYGD